MELHAEEVHYQVSRGIHWTRIRAELEGGEATILVCALRNYIADQYHIRGSVTKEHQQRWLGDVLEEIKSSSKEFEPGEVYRLVYAHTEEGKVNGMKFLTDEVAP